MNLYYIYLSLSLIVAIEIQIDNDQLEKAFGEGPEVKEDKITEAKDGKTTGYKDDKIAEVEKSKIQKVLVFLKQKVKALPGKLYEFVLWSFIYLLVFISSLTFATCMFVIAIKVLNFFEIGDFNDDVFFIDLSLYMPKLIALFIISVFSYTTALYLKEFFVDKN
ncbi:hypothetical protein NGRA_2740 [Nosema granulosis]|uniref:Uncharacterized protein n=1 Tax=Nosema granulosis TaxID=83296 RepID=A0A9P6KY55_9MICR|nr:hypothetical protein NGRA_2740 [Nosema granulosis]